jgi:hypothetical protein
MRSPPRAVRLADARVVDLQLVLPFSAVGLVCVGVIEHSLVLLLRAVELLRVMDQASIELGRPFAVRDGSPTGGPSLPRGNPRPLASVGWALQGIARFRRRNPWRRTAPNDRPRLSCRPCDILLSHPNEHSVTRTPRTLRAAGRSWTVLTLRPESRAPPQAEGCRSASRRPSRHHPWMRTWSPAPAGPQPVPHPR